MASRARADAAAAGAGRSIDHVLRIDAQSGSAQVTLTSALK